MSTLPPLTSRRAYTSWFTRNGYLAPGIRNIPDQFLTPTEKAWLALNYCPVCDHFTHGGYCPDHRDQHKLTHQITLSIL